MKYAVLTARILLGLAMLAAGVMNILHLNRQSMPGDAGLFLSLLATHGYMTVVALVMVVGGLLLLVGRFVPLGLTLLGPVVVNILLFHLLLAHAGLPIALLVVALELFLIFAYRLAFRGVFSAGPEVLGSPKL